MLLIPSFKKLISKVVVASTFKPVVAVVAMENTIIPAMEAGLTFAIPATIPDSIQFDTPSTITKNPTHIRCPSYMYWRWYFTPCISYTQHHASANEISVSPVSLRMLVTRHFTAVTDSDNESSVAAVTANIHWPLQAQHKLLAKGLILKLIPIILLNGSVFLWHHHHLLMKTSLFLLQQYIE